MKMMLMLCTVALLLGSIQAFTHEDANKYMDKVLNGSFQEEAKYSRLIPYEIDDIKIDFNTSVGNRGSVALTKGRLNNMSKVKRAGDCTVPHWLSANINFICFLEFDHLGINYTGSSLNFTRFDPYATITGTKVLVQVTASKKENRPILKLMSVHQIGSMYVRVWYKKSEADLFIKVFPSVRGGIVKYVTIFLHQALNGRFNDALAYSIYKTPIGFLSD